MLFELNKNCVYSLSLCKQFLIFPVCGFGLYSCEWNMFLNVGEKIWINEWQNNLSAGFVMLIKDFLRASLWSKQG